ncbi:MAG: shikimate dehydrogenase [Magnetococcales bacterium]|nr:shikimate dehydrogenase [Magnetococcales bacterium]
MSSTFAAIDGKTRLLGVIGDPVHHTLSPGMHNLACADLGLNIRYLPLHVRPENLADAVKGLRAIGAMGFNATIPHKEALLPLMDTLDPVAEMIGAVNTVVIGADGRLSGYNTDAYGFMTALREVFSAPLEELTVVVLGAGGAARGVLAGLSRLGAGRIFLANRTWSKAVDLAERFNALPVPWDRLPLEGCGLLINTTSLGLGGTDVREVDLSRLPGSALVYDIVYSPPLTPLLAAARARGLKGENGLGMLIHQGARAFEIWTGQKMPVAKVRSLLGGLAG